MAVNSVGFAQIDDMIARLRGMPEAIRERAPGIAELVRKEVEADIAAGRAPTGEAWKPKKDGGRPLVNAAKALTARAVGTVLLLTLSGVEVWHHFGTRRTPARPMLPGSGMPKNIAEAIRRGCVEVFKSKVVKRG